MSSDTRYCRRCNAQFSGFSPDGFCGACMGERRRTLYSDPPADDDWLNLQLARMAFAIIHGRLESGEVLTTGICDFCNRPMDDHRLCYTQSANAPGLCSVH